MAIISAARSAALLLAAATLPADSKPVALGTYDDLVWDKYLVIFYHTCACFSVRMGKSHFVVGGGAARIARPRGRPGTRWKPRCATQRRATGVFFRVNFA